MIDEELDKLFKEKDQNLTNEIIEMNGSVKIVEKMADDVKKYKKWQKDLIKVMMVQMDELALIMLKTDIETLKEVQNLWKMHRLVIERSEDNDARMTAKIKTDLENRINEARKDLLLPDEQRISLKWITDYFKSQVGI